MNERGEGEAGFIAAIGFLGLLLLGVVVLGMWGCPKWTVYSQQKHGEAELARASSNRQIAVQEAEAKREAASKLAEADTLRALGVAASNRIIGHSLRDNPDYLTWLKIEALRETKDQVIYVPTETMLPIMEATRGLARKSLAPPAP